jgi:hypothetical protein
MVFRKPASEITRRCEGHYFHEDPVAILDNALIVYQLTLSRSAPRIRIRHENRRVGDQSLQFFCLNEERHSYSSLCSMGNGNDAVCTVRMHAHPRALTNGRP